MYNKCLLLVFLTSYVHIAKSNVDHGGVFHPGVGQMFQSLAISIFNELQGHNTSVGGDLLSKISLLNGGMKQLIWMVDNKTDEIFQTFLPMIRTILEDGEPYFNKIKFEDHELQKRFSWGDEQMKTFHCLHSDIKNQLQQLKEICKFHNVTLRIKFK